MLKHALLALPLLAAGPLALADNGKEPIDVLQELLDNNKDSKYLWQSEQNVMMMPDSPAYWVAEEGAELFHTPRGPNNVSMEECDFGKGPGVLEGAYAEMPRYFEDTGKVMDLETRIVHCQVNVQGFASDDPTVKQRHGSSSDHMRLQTYIASKSNGYEWNPPLDHPLEKAFRDAGQVLFYRRAGATDFGCQSCHIDEGKQIRASVLPSVKNPQEWTKAVSWPAIRVGQDNVRSTFHRIRGCVYQMRHAGILGGSDAAIAISSFWTDQARGNPAVLPDMKR